MSYCSKTFALWQFTEFNNTLIDNSFYTLSDKKPTIVTYYNIDKEHSALDPGAKIAYNNIGPDSPLRFHRITDFIIYGFTVSWTRSRKSTPARMFFWFATAVSAGRSELTLRT